MSDYEYVKVKKSKKKREFSKIIVSLVVLLNTIFTAVVLYIFFKNENEPTALIAAWFAFTTGELWLLSKIKKNKDKNKRESEDNF